MKSFRRNTRGQFAIIAALLISMLTLSLVLSIHRINLNRQQLSYQPVQELVLGITSDLDRALTHALSNATIAYNATGNEEYAIKNGTAFISKWVNSILASYSHLGIRMNINETGEGLTDVSWKIGWSKPIGISQVYTRFDLDVEAYGFKGWVGQSGKFVTLRLYPDTIDITSDNESTTLQFQVMHGKAESLPIPNLTPDSLHIWAYVTKTIRVPANITSLTYLGGGNYTVTFSPKVFEYTLGVDMTVATPGDNIFVSTYYNKDASFLLTLQSQEDTAATQNKGKIQFGAVTYNLPTTNLETDPATYFLEYTPENDSYAFVNWTTTGSITVQDAFSSITSITIKGNGTATAFYKRIIPVLANVTLTSRDWEQLHPPNMGNVTLASVTYSLPNFTSLFAGDYALHYEPINESYRFLWWEATGGVALWNPYSNSTTVTITGNGTITAVYMVKPPVQIPDPILLSQEDNNASMNLGQIRLGESVLNLNNSLLTNSGTYLLEYLPQNGSYTFLNWTTSGFITVANPLSNPTAVTVSGDGIIIAFYHYETSTPPQTFNLTLNSAELDGASQNLGNITLNSTTYSLPTSVTLSAGDHSLEYIPYAGADFSYVFVRWETNGNIIVWNSTNNVTNIRIVGDGTLTAVYYTEPSLIEQATVTLQSTEESSSPTILDKAQLGEILFELPNTTTVSVGTYLLEYFPTQGYTFVGWMTTGDVNVENASSVATRITVNGNSTITALYRGCDITLDSRHWENLSINLGKIRLGTATYTLQNYAWGLAAGNYDIQFIPVNSSNIFLWWEFSGNIIPLNSTRNNTTLRILGDGNLTAVYTVKPSPPASATVNLRSLEATGASQNIGTIQLGATVFALPNSATLFTGTYLLEYTPAAGYTFVNWTVTVTSGSIVVQNLTAQTTSVTINGNGTITAFYRGCIVSLSSRHWQNSTYNLGTITFGTANYSLPRTLTGLPQADYFLQYIPVNSSYVFLWWEQSGNVMPWNFTSNSTMATVYGDGNITAVYALVTEPPPPVVGEWNTLYVDKGPILVPPFMWSLKSSHIPSWASTGADKQEVVVYSPPAPTIYLARYVNITAYVGIDPGWNAKSIYIEFGYNYSGQFYRLGNGTFPVSSDGVYRMTIDSLLGEYPGEVGVIPEGSIFKLWVVVTFYRHPWGTFKLYYGPNQPSRIDLF